MDIFYLMHRDNKIAVFAVDNDSVLSFKMNEDCYELLPYGVHDLRSFANWLEDRAIPAVRYATLGNGFSRLQFLLNNDSLSLSDSYWTCPVKAVLSWTQANLYNNSFVSTTILDNFNEIETIAYKTNFVPSSSLKGDLAKKWMIDFNNVKDMPKMFSACNWLTELGNSRSGRIRYANGKPGADSGSQRNTSSQ